MDERGKNDYTLWRPRVHSNFEDTKQILGLVAQNTYRNVWLLGLKYWSKYWQIINNLDERGKNDYKLWRPIVHSNFIVTKLILGLVAQNTYINAWLKGLEYWSNYWQIIVSFDEREKNYYTFWRPIVHSNFEVTKLILGLVAQNT